MRIDVQFTDRVGIAHEILAVLARRDMNVVAVEVEPPHVFIDIPQLGESDLPALRAACMAVAGVNAVEVVDILPGARRRLHLDALMAAMADPVMAVDAHGRIVAVNAAAAAVAGMSEREVYGKAVHDLFGEPEMEADLIANHFRMPAREVMLRDEPFQG